MTASLVGMTLPSWASHLENKLARPPLLLVQAFVDTLDLDLHTDVLAHADEARAWLADAGLRAPEQPDFDADLRLARDVRESVRAMIGQNTGGGPLTPGQPTTGARFWGRPSTTDSVVVRPWPTCPSAAMSACSTVSCTVSPGR